MRASSCDHCTNISIARTLGIQDVLGRLQPYVDKIAEDKANGEDQSLAQKYGVIFEAALINELLESVGKDVVGRPEKDGDMAQTLELMNSGVPVIYQGGLKRTFERTIFSGMPDFLVHQDWEILFVDGKLTARKRPENINSPRENKYTVWDAKYGGQAKPAYLLQVGLYVDALDALGLKAEGERHGLILGSRTTDSFEEIEIVPAMRLARKKISDLIDFAEEAKNEDNLDRFSAANLNWHCPSKQNCDICEYPDLCKDDRKSTDDLVQVANITQNQIARLATSDITTMKQLAQAPDDKRPYRMTVETYDKIRKQAAAQVRSQETGEPYHELLADPMIQFLPPRSAGDVFFDFEGFPYFTERGGLEYLFGNYDWGTGENEGEPLDRLFTEFWAHDRATEKVAFEGFMEWALKRMHEDEGAHIYHYASYEVTALKRLAMRHGIYEQEVAWLISTGRLVDMFNIVRNSMIIGEESYSIKKLERHYNFVRSSDVQKASASIDEYDRWRELDSLSKDLTLSEEDRAKISAEADQVYKELRLYNLEDVWSTRELYRWLEEQPGASSKYGQPQPGDPKPEDADRTPSKSERELAELQAQTKELFDVVADWDWGKDAAADYRAQIWLALTHSILFYKREEVMFWADIAIRMLMDDEALEGERTAAAITDVVEVSRETKERREDGSPYVLVTYNALLPEDCLYMPEKNADIVVRYRGEGNKQLRDFGKITEVVGSDITFTRTIRNGSDSQVPNAVIDATYYSPIAKQTALQKLANDIAEQWKTPLNAAPSSPAIMDLLMRRPPKLQGITELPVADTDNYLPAVMEAVNSLDHSILAIQGPPGSGKTYLASRTIVNLIKAGKRIGVTANSHSAIENLLEACIEAGVDPEMIIKRQEEGEERPWVSKKSNGPVVTWMKNNPDPYIVGGTSFFFSNKDVREYRLDYLFIDEAAQYSLVDCMAVSGIADNLVLMGDPQQLAQVVTAVHPGGVENSALGHYMGEQSILPTSMGYFVEVTRRLHPEVNHAVSWLAYEGKLRSHPSTEKNAIIGHDQGLISIPVPHTGNSTSSEEEAEVVIKLVKSLKGDEDPANVLVVAAYNAQVDLLRAMLDEAGFENVMVGTVDKFQGREGMAVIYSFAASSSMDAPRGLEFLLDRNRLNVAISRAKATCYLVFSESLLESQFKTVAEVKAVSRLAGLLEIAAK
jgi:predicted RecB family nuclease